MEIAVLIFIGCAAWFAYHIYKGYTGTDQEGAGSAGHSTNITVTATATASPRQRREWTRTQIESLPLKVLSRTQWECLGDGADGTAIVITPPFNRYDVREDGAKGHPSKTVTTLVKHGLLRVGEGGTYFVTESGICAVESLNVK